MNTGMRRKRAATGNHFHLSDRNYSEKVNWTNCLATRRKFHENDEKFKKSELIPFTTCYRTMPFLNHDNNKETLRQLLEDMYRQIKGNNYDFLSPHQIYEYYKKLCNCEI